MTAELSVAAVREALERSAQGERGDGEPSTRLLGQIFHQVHADLVGPDPLRNGPRFLLDLERDRKVWKERLLDQCYTASVGPRLARYKAYLQATTPAVLAFWEAVRELVEFVAEITWRTTENQPSPAWEELGALLQAEAPLVCDLHEPGWSGSVRLTGVADCLLRVPEKDAWCAIELKLGQTSPAVDLGQAALYHLIAARLDAARGSSEPRGALAMVRFSPRRQEVLFQAPELRDAQARLLALIGRLAGVTSATPTRSPSAAAHVELAERVKRAYREYGKDIELEEHPTVGPRFVRFGARLGKGVRYEQIKNLGAEIGLRLGLSKDPIISRTAGRLTIDLLRPDPQVVPFDAVARRTPKLDPLRGSSRLLVGVGIDGQARYADLSDPINAHALVAGTTGSGKTEWLRSAIASLLIENTPDTLRLALLDPKQTAFTDLKKSPFLWTPHGFWVPGGEVGAADVLGELVVEMERRYTLLAEAGVDDLRRYVEKTSKRLPRVVVFCDEYYALLAASSNDKKRIEAAVGLLGAKARASGIHLVLAMQQASRKIIQGSIDTNIPCRVALMTSSAIESRMVLHADGADQLTGYGDLLYKDIGDPVRLQAPYLEPEARARIFSGGALGAGTG